MAKIPSVASLNPAKKAFSLIEEFKAFAFKGNVIDLAVGVIIGAAFGKIINSLVNHIIMPLVSILMPSQNDYTHWAFVVNDKKVPYGLFLGEVVNFLIVAAALFIVIVKLLGFLMRQKKAQAEAASAPATRECPACCEQVAIRATRCKFCASELPPAVASATE